MEVASGVGGGVTEEDYNREHLARGVGAKVRVRVGVEARAVATGRLGSRLGARARGAGEL